MSERSPALPSALAAAVACAVILAGCGAGGASSTPVARAAYVTSNGPGYRFVLKLTSSVSGQTFAIAGTGAIDPHGLQGSMRFVIAGKTLNEVLKSPFLYVQIPTNGGRLWAKVNLSAVQQVSGGASSLTGTNSDPTQFVTFLRAAQEVTPLGAETIRGVQTHGYHAVIDLNRYASLVSPDRQAAARHYADLIKRARGTSTLPVDVWIDDAEHVRRLQMQLSLCSTQGRVTTAIAMDIYGYGPIPPAQLPPPSQVKDLTSRLAATTSQSLAQLHC